MSYQQSPPNMPTQLVLTFHAVPCVYYYHSNFVSWKGLCSIRRWQTSRTQPYKTNAPNKNDWQGQISGLAVKTPLAHIREPGFDASLWLPTPVSCWCAPWKAAGADSKEMGSCQQCGRSGLTSQVLPGLGPGSASHSAPAIAGHFESEPVDGMPLFFFSNKYIILITNPIQSCIWQQKTSTRMKAITLKPRMHRGDQMYQCTRLDPIFLLG